MCYTLDLNPNGTKGTAILAIDDNTAIAGCAKLITYVPEDIL